MIIRVSIQIIPMIAIGALLALTACKKGTPEKLSGHNPEVADLGVVVPPEFHPSNEFKAYWYSGKAEITSYEIEQARYGEMRPGNSVLIFVTEPFLAKEQVKADTPDKSAISVLKLNRTKNYLTGIYPYSIMTSTFLPVKAGSHALKLSFSAQEWCGQVYSQLNNRELFEVESHSYFASEADQRFSLPKNWLEDELWTLLRLDPHALPQGKLDIVPSFEYLRLLHKEVKPYPAEAALVLGDSVSHYELTYPRLKRTLRISFGSKFPYLINGWTDTYTSGAGDNAQQLVSTGRKIKTLITPYWQQNGNNDLSLRDSLGL